MNIFKLYLFIAILFLSQLASAHEQEFAFKRLTALEKQGIDVSAFAIRMSDNKVLADISSNKHLIPASTTKLVIASQALETWGPNKTFTSKILRRGEVHDGVLQGDLIFYGGGDPALINEKLTLFISDVARSGIKKVTGKLIVNNSLFGNLIQDKARSRKSSHNSYDAPLSSAALNYSILGFLIKPGQNLGAKAKIAIEPYDLPSVTIVNSVKTTSKTSKTHIDIDRVTRNDQDIYYISGKIALNARERRIYRSVSNADRYAGEVISAYLRHEGIKIVNPTIEIESTPMRSTDKIVASIEGSPLSEQLNGLLQMSNNFIADMLLLNLSVKNGSIPGFQASLNSTLENTSATIQNYMQSMVADESIVLKSGSGLTPENRLSAKNLVGLLKKIFLDTSKFDIFLNSLTKPGQIGTLQTRFKKFSSPNTNVFFRAKTGTLTEPYPVVSLAGYGQSSTKDWITFAFIINGTKAKHSLKIDELRQALDADVTDFLQSRATAL